MAIVMRVIAFASGGNCPIAGQYLKSFDFNAHQGIGYGEFTKDIEQAKRFEGLSEALAYWNTVSDKYPIRWYDGRPNKPLTATTVTFDTVPEE